MENKHYIIIGILILGLIFGSIYYYTSREEESIEQIKEISKGNNSGIVLGDADSQTQTNNNTTVTNNKNGTITTGEVYLAKINELRKPINAGFDDLNAKMKYKTLFTDEDAQKAIDDLTKMINDSLETVKNLKIDAKFKEANEKEIESLTLLSEAMDAFQKLYVSTDQDEKTKLNDIYSYKIDQSNNILNNVAIPK